MTDRRIDVFFYGLYMDEAVLREHGVEPADPRRACVEGYGLRIGRRATLLPCPGERAYGMLFALTHGGLERLYGAPGLEAYCPEAVHARPLPGGAPVPALCYNLREPPAAHERDPDYAARLARVLARLGFPAAYVDSVA